MRRRPNGALVPAALVLVLALLLSVACAQVSVKRIESLADAPTGNRPVSSPPGDVRDVAVTAVDFDPPLGQSVARAPDRVSLLAVVENRGNQAAEHVSVRVQLFGLDDEHPLLEALAIVERLVPGESKVVQFNGLSGLPAQSVYRLVVSASPLVGELLVWNNARTYRIELAGEVP
ncbi:MAG: hypothetical protein HY331_05230 [Chloroflexi bacterium]|nr:hypothetical protein [Chloroflexota bacterium]